MDAKPLLIKHSGETTFLSVLLERLPFVAEYDLSKMRGSVRITFPRRLGGFSISRDHKGTAGKLSLRLDRSDTPGVLDVTVTRLDVHVGHIALPLRNQSASGPRSFNMVSLGMYAPDGKLPSGTLDMNTGVITPLKVTLELKGQHIRAPFSRKSGPVLIQLTLLENLSLADGILKGAGEGIIAGGLLQGTLLAFAHAKPPPPCNTKCNCTPPECPHGANHNCGAPGCGAAGGHAPHCLQNGCNARGNCNGVCNLPAGHAGPHACAHGHGF